MPCDVPAINDSSASAKNIMEHTNVVYFIVNYQFFPALAGTQLPLSWHPMPKRNKRHVVLVTVDIKNPKLIINYVFM